jgi:hypothetical protein
VTDSASPLGDDTPDDHADGPRATRRRIALTVGGILVAGGLAVAVWAIANAAAPAPSPEAAPTSAVASSPSSSAPVAPSTPTPTSVASPEVSASAPPTDAAPPAANAPVIDDFTVDPVVAACSDERESTVPLRFSWSTSGADRAWIGVATSDASVQPTAEVATDDAAYTGVSFACRDADQVFTLTVQGSGGTTSRTIAIPRELG